jgi:mono/diheme cytochrome c family protein
MKPQATGLTDKQIGAVAVYLNSLGLTAGASMPAAADISVAGRALYVRNCITCHMPDGSGVPSLQPALLGNAVVRGEPAPLIRAVLRGPPLAGSSHAYRSMLSDLEAADLLTYVRQALAPGAAAISREEIVRLNQP